MTTQQNVRLDDQTGRRIETLDTLRHAQWNVVGQHAFQERVRLILDSMASAVSRTLGPAGSTTIIEQSGAPHITKDGWSVIRQFKYAERIDRNIYEMLSRISGQVVSTSGDGTTTAIVAANAIRHNIQKYIDVREEQGIKVRPRNLIKEITTAIGTIIEQLDTITTRIDLDTEEGIENIRSIALISTNGDEELTNAIVEIYKNTKNPVISVEKALGRNTDHTIIDGYRSAMGYVDGQYAAGTEDWIVKAENPLVLLFDHHVSKEKHEEFLTFAFQEATSRYINSGQTKKQTLIIAAPFYDQHTMNMAKEWLFQYTQENLPVRVIFTRVNIVQAVDKKKLDDLAALLGSKVLDERICGNYTYFEYKPADNPGEEFKKVYPHRSETPFDINTYLGRCGEALIGNEGTLFRDLIYRNENMVDIRLADAQEQLRRYEAKAQKLGAIELERQDAVIRLSSLSCSMGSISVGGDSSLHQEQKIDALDDAIKACESAYRHGFVMGGSFAIPYAIQNYLQRRPEMTQVQVDLLILFRDAFLHLFVTITDNAQMDIDIIEVFKEVCKTGKCLNIETNEYDNLVVNPVQTDIQILKSAVSIVTLILTSNQYLTQLPEFVIKETLDQV